jgi:hypothetical protein
MMVPQEPLIFDGNRLNSKYGLKGRIGHFYVVLDTECFLVLAGWRRFVATRPRDGFPSADLIVR